MKKWMRLAAIAATWASARVGHAQACPPSTYSCGGATCCSISDFCCAGAGSCCSPSAPYCCGDGTCAAFPNACSPVAQPMGDAGCPGYDVPCGSGCIPAGSDCCDPQGRYCPPGHGCVSNALCDHDASALNLVQLRPSSPSPPASPLEDPPGARGRSCAMAAASAPERGWSFVALALMWLGCWRRLGWLIAGAVGCSNTRVDGRSGVVLPQGCSPNVTFDAQSLIAADPADLVSVSGRIAKTGPTSFSIRSQSVRMDLGREPRGAVQIDFVYRGLGAHDEPLASGELRRQIGLKLRARDTCNVVYVMWHIEPSHVSVKSNPGQNQHTQCRDRGYVNVTPTSIPTEIAAIRVGERHTLRAAIVGDELHVVADDVLSWVGRLPPQAFDFDGPVGIRSDNADFDVELRASRRAVTPP